MRVQWFLCLSLACLPVAADLRDTSATPARNEPTPGDRLLAEYFRAETDKLTRACLSDIQTLEDWKSRRETYRQQLFEMLGLSPLPPRTELRPVITGKIERELFTVEKLHFQSLPQLYVTADLYLPKNLNQPAPAVLYVCGHSNVKKDGVSLGNKTGYQHHGEWFARNGYVCLVMDTIQLGEIQGLHHGTYREGMWWWNSRGYTPAGVEAWNGIRALDYLQSRPEVDGRRLGITGRSGGGAYSWWVAALDERVRVAAPVAGITDLHNHVIDGTVQGHCDCMFMVNTYRWDYPQVAALIAPRPLLLCNSDKDAIFPLDGVERLHEKVRHIYRLYGASTNFGLLITEGPHKDTQDLQVPVFRWFNRHLKGEDLVIEMAATKFFEPEQLKVFTALPADERVTKIHETFVPRAPAPAVPENATDWAQQRDGWRLALQEKCFRGWPTEPDPLEVRQAFDAETDGVRLRAFDFSSQEHVPLRLYLAQSSKRTQPKRVELEIWDDPDWSAWLRKLQAGFAKQLAAEIEVAAIIPTNKSAAVSDGPGFAEWKRRLQSGDVMLAGLAPRGIGLTAWNPTAKEKPHVQRRFMLLGQTLDGMRVWDIRRGVQALRAVKGLEKISLELSTQGSMAVNVLYASLFEPAVAGLQLRGLPASHQAGPDYLNVLRVLDVPQVVAMAAERAPVQLQSVNEADWNFPASVGQRLNWPAGRVSVNRE